MPRLADLYRGSSLSSSTVSGLAGTTATLSAIGTRRRAQLLQQAVAEGKVSPTQVSPSDQHLIQAAGFLPSISGHDSKSSGDGGPAKDVWDFLGNTLGYNKGRGLLGAAINLPGGLLKAGEATLHDTLPFATLGVSGALGVGPSMGDVLHHSELADLGKGIANQYAYTYAGKGAPKGSTFWDRFSAAPLGPLLDVGSVFSGGATGLAKVGGTIARSAEVGSTLSDRAISLANITSKGGRLPVQRGLGDVGRPIEREFSRSPTRKYFVQKPLDRLVATAPARVGGDVLRGLAERRWANKATDEHFGELTAETHQAIHDVIQPVSKVFKKLKPKETIATMLSMRGINSDRYLNLFQESVRRSLEGDNVEAQQNIAHYIGVSVEYVKSLAEIDPEIRGLVNAPTPNMVHAAATWTHAVEAGRETLGVDPAQHAMRISSPQRALQGNADRVKELRLEAEVLRKAAEMHPDEASLHNDLAQKLDDEAASLDHTVAEIPHPDYPIQPTYVPDMAAENMKYATPRLAAGLIPGLDAEKVLMRGRREARVRTPTAEQVFGPSSRSYLKAGDMGTMLSGTVRLDDKVLVEHLAQRERDLIKDSFSQDFLEKVVARDENGEMALFRTPDEMQRSLGSRTSHVFIPEGVATKFFRQESNTLESLMKVFENMKDQGKYIDEDGSATLLLNTLMKDHAEEFVNTITGSTKAKGYAMPVQEYKRAMQHMKVYDPLPPVIRQYANLQNKWRSLVLSLSPRWWINTAVGSFFMNLLKGVWNPRDYQQAVRLMHSGKVPGRVRQEGIIGVESHEPGRQAFLEGSVTKKIASWVNDIEGFFRTASFVKELRTGDKQAMAEIGESMKNFPVPFTKADNTYIDELLDDPNLVNSAVDEVNRFSYHYGVLNPIERRYVRLVVPFFGWYKFITKFMWRLPVNYPGRADMLLHLGEVGYDSLQNELKGTDPSTLPAWLQGIIGVQVHNGKLSYHSTFGLNPLANFADPFSDSGAFQGVAPLSSLNPLVQSTLKAFGVDPLNPGSQMEFDPTKEHYEYDRVGRLIDLNTGKEVNVSSVAPVRRFLGSLINSVPQAAIINTVLTGGRPEYPESIPFVAPRIIQTAPGDRRPEDFKSLLEKYAGLDTKHYNLAKNKAFSKEMLDAARSTHKNKIKTIKSRARH